MFLRLGLVKPLKYFIFAVFCTVLNLAIQFCVFSMQKFSHPMSEFLEEWAISQSDLRLTIAIICGTLAGLVTKFILDKYLVFEDWEQELSTELKKFTIYSGLGIITTLIFWFVEWSFYIFWNHPAAKYVGGALGLSVGYTLKYYLDKRYVFKQGMIDYEL